MSGTKGMRSTKAPVPSAPGDREVDNRRRVPRWIASREAEVREHLGGAPSVMQESLARRFVFLEMLTINMEVKITDGQNVEVLAYLGLVDRLHGLARTLGLKRIARNVPTLADLKRAAEAAPK